MKKNQLVKFSLSVVCAAVLAACSSSSGDNGAAEAAKAKAAQEAAAIAAAEAEAKAAEEAAAAAKAAEEAAKAAEEAKVANVVTNRQGGKFVKKTDSDLEIGLNETGKTSTSQGEVVNMNIKLHRSLDTVVVASNTENTNTTDKIGYLEDYDFRKSSQAELDDARTSGTTTLSHIYKDSTNTNGTGVARSKVEGKKVIAGSAEAIIEESIRIRNNTEDTKTDTKGVDEGTALVFQQGRQNYIGTDEKVLAGNSDTFYLVEGGRDRSNTVTEVYGHRTFVIGDAETGVDVAVDTAANAPFQSLAGNKAGIGYSAGTLSKVQYGRVTSALDTDRGLAAKAGIETGSTDTLVVGYADYNAPKSENNYFYRGVDATTGGSTLLGDLANTYATNVDGAKTPAGSLQYQGHAVTYGFTHVAPDADLPKNGAVPNAVYSQADYIRPTLVSGTHVAADIDLSTRAVTGNLYDVWAFAGDSTSYIAKDIATFNGTLANSGEINGTSTRTLDNAAGSLSANLYGSKAEELGGAIASSATSPAESWGAVFGATIQNPEYAPTTTVTPKSPWSSTTDQVNSK